MGKYKQWLHHQEIGRRLRDQISTLELERTRVQKMAPSHPTSLPDLDNPLIAALLSYTKQGNRLSDIDPIKAALPVMVTDPDQRQPVTSAGTAAPSAAPFSSAPASDSTVVSSLLARAEQIPADPLDQMRELSRAREVEESDRSGASAASEAAPSADSVGGWWQRHQADE